MPIIIYSTRRGIRSSRGTQGWGYNNNNPAEDEEDEKNSNFFICNSILELETLGGYLLDAEHNGIGPVILAITKTRD